MAEVTAATLAGRGAGGAVAGGVSGGPVVAAEVLDAVIVRRDRRLLELLQAEVLAPLAGAVPGSRAALRATLRSYLVHLGNRRAVSDELGVHPQTVRYRLGRLAELFGPVLEDPAGRLRLLLALAWDPDEPGDRPERASAGAAEAASPAGSAEVLASSAAEYLLTAAGADWQTTRGSLLGR